MSPKYMAVFILSAMRPPSRSISLRFVPFRGSTVLPSTHSRSHHHFLIGLMTPFPALSSHMAILLRMKGNLLATQSHHRWERRRSVLEGQVFIQRPQADPFRFPSRYLAHFSESGFHIS